MNPKLKTLEAAKAKLEKEKGGMTWEEYELALEAAKQEIAEELDNDPELAAMQDAADKEAENEK